MNEKLERLKKWEFKRSAYDLLLSTAYFDDETIAPSGGREYRYERLAYMASESYKISTDHKIETLLDELKKEDLAFEERRTVELLIKDFQKIKAIPQDVYEEYTKLTLQSTAAWQKAKSTNDYSIFKPYLLKIIATLKKIALLREPEKDVYDTLLDDYEPFMTTARYDVFFDLIKKELLPLIAKIQKAKPITDDFLYKYYPKDRQEKLMTKLKEVLGFTSDWGYMGVSMHPFTSGFSKYDVRITTAYDEHNIASAIYSLVHEAGHAFYEHQMAERFDGTILKAVSSGMHESQSRLLENFIGRRRSFIKNFYPFLKELYADQLKDVTLDDFTRAVCVAKPSLIRTDADELTYPIHILIRYELEKGIFDGSIKVEDLDEVWSDMYYKYLGIRPDDMASGILQDIHWSQGSFGYFPTYALGSAISAQIMHKLEEDIDVDGELEKGNLKVLTDYLGEHIHQYGALFDLDDLLKKATGEEFDPHYYIDYLKDKYTKLYHLDEGR